MLIINEKIVVKTLSRNNQKLDWHRGIHQAQHFIGLLGEKDLPGKLNSVEIYGIELQVYGSVENG